MERTAVDRKGGNQTQAAAVRTEPYYMGHTLNQERVCMYRYTVIWSDIDGAMPQGTEESG